MKIIIAYGSPGSGKSTFLSSLGFDILNLDSEKSIINIETKVKKFFFNNNNNTIVIDAPFFYKSNIELFINDILSKIINIKDLVIYDFIFNKNAALLNDKNRNRDLSCKNSILNYKYENLNIFDLNINTVDNIEIIKKDTYNIY